MKIIQKPITFDDERIALTRQYRQEHYDIQSDSIEIEPQIVVLHWTEFATLEQSYDFMKNVRINNRPDIESGGDLNVSAHFLVDRDGTIYQLMSDNWMARHVIGLNNVAIGIENVGGVNSVEDLTDHQVIANIALVQHLQKKFTNIKHLIGHFEYEKYKNTPLWLEKNNNYFNSKVDPGPKFMMAVRFKMDSR